MTSIGTHRRERARDVSRAPGSVLQRWLLVAGVLSSLVYVVADQVSAARYPGYRLADQAISELSAIGAPTARLWSTLMVVYEVLFLAFVIGVLRAAGPNRALRASGAVLLVFGISGPLWSLFPMHTRGTELTWQDTGHLVMGGATLVMLLLFVGFGAFALGRRFRVFSFAAMAAILVGGAGTFAFVERVAAAQPTPWLGLVERIMIYGYLLWVAVLSAALVRRSRPHDVP